MANCKGAMFVSYDQHVAHLIKVPGGTRRTFLTLELSRQA
jgi:hypothetical protein